ncbi:MAG: sodium-dependent transporter [Betaproteobacteria bacterium]|nr:sodium-dependent transporter [Betaproteobacteria bacterium]
MDFTMDRGQWSGRGAFVLAAAGSAVGLGNIWKFPYLAGEHGGGAFVLMYLACVAVVGVPVMMTEIMLGRRAQRNPVAAMAHLAREAGASSAWKLVGVMGVVAGAIILSFYSVVAGWIIDYLVRAATGSFAGLDPGGAEAALEGLLGNPHEQALWHSVFMLLTMGVVACGVMRGLERAARIMMPALAAIMLVLTGYGLAQGDMGRALAFMFAADFTRISPQTVLAAVGQAFFSLSLGMGAIMVYGSYLERHILIARATIYVACADTAFALLAGLAVFSIVFAHGMAPASGPGLILKTLPVAFGGVPGGALLGSLFFLLVVFAAWTSSISIAEPGIAWMVENLRLGRGRACVIFGALVWVLGIAALLSFNLWQDVKLFGLSIFDALDYLASNILLPVGGLLIVVFGSWVMRRTHAREELPLGERWFGVWRFAARYVAPVGVTLIFLNVTGLLG